MSSSQKQLSMFIALLLVIFVVTVGVQQLLRSSVATAVNAPLFDDAPAPNQRPERSTTALRSRYVTVNFDKLRYITRSGHPQLELPLFDDLTIIAQHQRTQQFAAGAFAWVGQDPSNIYSEISLSVNDDIMMGTVNLHDTLYRISYVGDGIHQIQQLPLDYRTDAEPMLPDTTRLQSTEAAPAAEHTTRDDGSVVDAMVLYTPAARDAVGGTEAMQALINLAVAETNTGYDNSGVNFDLRLVHAEEVTYTEPSSNEFSIALNELTNPSDGQIDHIHALRDTHKADVVVLLIDGVDYCGIAWLMTPETPSPASSAFSVVDYSCATGYYSFGHEIGHNMGAMHDRNQSGSGYFPYSYGYQEPSGQFRTIMAYRRLCNSSCPRVNYWSNPAVTYNGLATGIDHTASNSADNHLSINNTVDIVANFRQSSPAETPTPTSTPSPTPTNTLTPTATVTPTPLPTLTPTPLPTATPSPTPVPAVKAVIPVTGGSVSAGYLTIDIPPNTFTDTIILHFQPLSAEKLPARSPAADLTHTRHYQFELLATYESNGLPAEPENGAFYALTLTYDDSPHMLNLIDETTLQLYYWEESSGQWQPETAALLDPEANIVHASLDHFGTWALFGTEPDKTFLPIVINN